METGREGSSVGRRVFLACLAGGLLLAGGVGALLSFGPLGLAPLWAGALRRLLAGSAPPPALLESELTREGAARELARGLSPLRALALLVRPDALRAHLQARSAQDFREGHTRRLHGWPLSETELCVATLLAR